MALKSKQLLNFFATLEQLLAQSIHVYLRGKAIGIRAGAGVSLHRRKMSAHALLKMTRDLFWAMSLAPRQKKPRNVVEMKEARQLFLAVTALQFLATVRDQKSVWSKF